MGFRKSLANFIAGPPERKQDAAMRAILAVGPFQAKWMQTDYDTFAREGYAGNPYVYACMRQLAMAVAGIPWRVYDSEQKRSTFDKHPMLDLLHRPNPRQGQAAFFETMIGYLFLDGNNYIEWAGPEGKPPLELYCLRPDRVSVVPGTVASPVAGYVYKVGNQQVSFPATRVLHQKFFNPLNDWYGLSPMQAASRAVDQSNYAKAWNVALLQNGARPTGALSTQLAVEDEQYARLKAMIDEQYSGFNNAGRPLLLEGGMTWQEMGMSPEDMAWLDSQKLSAREIAMVYNIAPELIGDPESKTFSNYQEARKALYEENILPLMDWLRDDLNYWLSPLYDQQTYLDYDRDEIEALSEERDGVFKRNNEAFTSGWITINDAREAASLDKDSKYGKFYRWQLPSFALDDPLAPQSAPGSVQLPTQTPTAEAKPKAPSAAAETHAGSPPTTKPSEGGGAGVAKPATEAAPTNGHKKALDDVLMDEIARMR